MRKFVSSVIFGMITSLLCVLNMFFVQAPLLNLVYYGILRGGVQKTSENLVNLAPSADFFSVLVILIQILFVLAFAVVFFIFIKKVISIFLKDDVLVVPYYSSFFFCVLILPVVLTSVSVVFNLRLALISVIVLGIANVLLIVISVLTAKILPQTEKNENRKYLYSNEGKTYE